MGLTTVGRTTLHALRKGYNYLQFEEKLLSLHLASLDISSMDHSAVFIKGFVNNIAVVMDKRIKEHLRAVDLVTCRKLLFAFDADKVTELHKMGDSIGISIMTEEGNVKPIFIDYLLVTQHTGNALTREIYEETFVQKLGLTRQEIRPHCTGWAVFQPRRSRSCC